jgi:peptidoglycan/xylan/chitin deacetylase (PgdA/CDA1 family)
VRRARLGADDRYISFSFDDCPASALTAGRAILEEAGVRGTYYLAGSLADLPGAKPVSFEARSVPALSAAGHEVGCHTYGHVRMPDLAVERIVDQLDRNAAWLEGVLPGHRFESFSYPFGATSLEAKRTVGARYAGARSTREGINAGTVDLLLLRAMRIYERLGNTGQLLQLIERVSRGGGWLIFYTHDVEENPSPYGCTPRSFRDVVQAAAASGCSVRPVGDVLRAINAGDRAGAPP